MALWAKLIGGAAGYLIAGPVGGLIGLAVGAIADGAIDDDPTHGIPSLDIDARFIEDDLGRFVQLFFRKDVPNGAVVVALIHDSRGRPVRAVDAFAEKGNFVSHRAIERGKSEFYVPFSALRYRRPGVYTLMTTVIFMAPGADQPTTLGQKTFDFELPSPNPVVAICVHLHLLKGTWQSKADFLGPCLLHRSSWPAASCAIRHVPDAAHALLGRCK